MPPGDRVPLITNSRISDTSNTVLNTIQYQQIGIILEVTPRINPDGFVKLVVHPEISSLSEDNVEISAGVKARIISSRMAETTVTVQDGHTIVIGGLITTNDQSVEDKVPILGDIPLLGWLFRNTHKIKNRSELLIILTPTVIRNVQESDVETRTHVKRLNLLRGDTKYDDYQRSLFRSLHLAAPDDHGPSGQGDRPAQPGTPAAKSAPPAKTDAPATAPNGAASATKPKVIGVTGPQEAATPPSRTAPKEVTP
jgi:type II secretory pathway component GspD/PulD (secretin)